MREILFCGNRTDNGERVVGFYHYTNWYNPITKEIVDTKHWILPVGCQEAFQVDPETVGQYAGLTDKNVAKIFEGDIVELECHGMGVLVHRGAVVFKAGCFGVEYDFYGLRFHRFGEAGKWQDMGASGTVTYTYKVIGNIHDNPELLKQ